MKAKIKEERHHHRESKRIRKRRARVIRGVKAAREKGSDRIRKKEGEVRAAGIKETEAVKPVFALESVAAVHSSRPV